jgi:hypothetical protein
MKPIPHSENSRFPLFIKTLMLLLLVVPFFCRQGWSAGIVPVPISGLDLMASYENGFLYQSGRIKVVQLNGTYKQMGRQYGKLLSGEMLGMYNEIIRQYTLNKMIRSEEQLETFSTKLFRLYPKRFQDLALGMSETSQIEMRKIVVLNGFFDLLLSRPQASSDHDAKGSHCSGVAVWGDYTGGAPLVMGRNFDFPPFYRKFSPYLVVVVFNPADGSRSAAVITYAGQIGAIQAFNDAGLVLENNDGSNSGDQYRYFGERTPFLIKDLEMVLDYSSLEGLDAAFQGTRIHYPLIFNVASPDRAYCYEMTTYDVKRRSAEREGLLIGINHFVNPEWKLPPPGKDSYLDDSALRHKNLARLAEQYKGKIDARLMMKILDVPQDKGGATPSHKSIYQFVAVPKLLKLWIKAPTYMNWAEIDLGSLFRPMK